MTGDDFTALLHRPGGSLLMRQPYLRVLQGRTLVGRTVLGQFDVRGEGS